MKDNAFVKVSPTTKNFLLMEKTESKISIRVFNRTRDVPYCDTFNTEEHWLILTTNPKAEKIIVRQSLNVIFKKSTMFKGKIENGALTSTKANFEHWCKWSTQRV